MSFFSELRKRRVFRVAGAYIIVAWLLVQVADIFFPALKLPEWSITLVAGLVILGFPIALLLAWAYQVTPDGVVRTSDASPGDAVSPPAGNKLNYVIVGLLVIVVALLIVDKFLESEGSRGEPFGAQLTSALNPVAGVILLDEAAPLASGVAAVGFDGPLIALSSDGRWLVYVGWHDGESGLFLRDLGKFGTATAIAGTEGAIHAFFSPDGAWIGFITDDKLKRVSLDGKEVQTIANLPAPVRARWMTEDTIFVIDEQAGAVRKVTVSSGEAERLIYSPSHRFSDVLDDGRNALGTRFPQSIDGDQGDIQVVSLEGGDNVSLGIRGYDTRNLGNGQLVFNRNGNLQLVAFDENKLEVSGQPRAIQDGIAQDSIFYQAQLAISETGTLAFVPGADTGVGRLVRQVRKKAPGIVTPQAMKYGVFDLSHDDTTLAIHVGDTTDYVLIFDPESQEGRKLPGSEGFGWPILSASGKIALSGLDQTDYSLVRLGHLDRTAAERDIRLPGLQGYPMDFSGDENSLAYIEWQDGGRIGRLSLSDDPTVEWVAGESGDWGSVFSPDDQWLAYSSNQTGRYEIWLRPADGTGIPRQLSVNGGIEPVWCDCGRVYYRRGDEIWFTPVGAGEQPEFGSESLALRMIDFLDTPGRSFDVSSDGETIYYVQLAEPAIDDRIHVISNFLASVRNEVADN